MARYILRLLGLAALVLGGAWGLFFYHNHFSTAEQIERLEQEKRQYQQIVERLTTETRVADLLVTDQQVIDGTKKTTVLFVEYARDGAALPPKSFVVEGEMVHLDAKMVKFDNDFVKENDPLRGSSIALFTRLYGDLEAPEAGHRIDQPGQIPEVYRGADARVTRFELELWRNFWRLLEEPDYRQQMGVRIAQGEGLWWPIEPQKLYTVTIESDGGLNLTWEPVKPIYIEALKNTARPSASASGATSPSASIRTQR